MLATDRKTGLLYLIEMWHRWSLDAPTVALVWRIFLARCAGVHLPWYAPILLVLGTWIVYVADRILDGLGDTSAQELRERHHFYARNRVTFGVLVCCATLLCGVLIIERMRKDIFEAYAVLGSLVLLYFFLIHGKRHSAERWLPKELFVGILFAAATALPIWMRASEKSSELKISVALFAVACWLNCAAIEWWERTTTENSARETAHPHISTRWLGKHLTSVSAMLTGASLVCWTAWVSPFQNVALACALSAICFGLLNWFRAQIGARWLRVAADASLLTPILLIPWLPA